MKVRRQATFYDHVKRALELIDQPEALGRESPLAAPYFLGPAVAGADASPRGWGLALGRAIEQAMNSMWGGPLPSDGEALLAAALAESPPAGRYECLILELNYLNQRYRPIPRNQAEIYSDILHVSRPTHDRHLRGAIESLGATLLQLLRPAIQLEQPAPPGVLIGREALLDQIAADLAAGRAVALGGPGGVGKTALAARATAAWSSPARFWYTFRPTLNDQLASLLFALGHFLHSLGASTLWQQLVAERGRQPEGGLALGLALADLAALPERPLLCFDELDTLRPLADDQSRPGHSRILEFLDGLRGHVPLLMIGQRPFWPADSVVHLDELSPPQLETWLATLGIPHGPEDAANLHRQTGGNPRLAELCVALYQAGAGASLTAVLDELPRSRALLPLWARLERRLSPAERRLIQLLAVFRAAAPADAWRQTGGESATMAQLIERRLVKADERGGVALLPALREVIADELPVELREELHQQAAQIRAERGEYTAAAYHLVCAGQSEAAISLWYARRDSEISQGRGGAALEIFSQISQRRLPARQRNELLFLRAELHELAGEPARVTADLADQAWPADDPASAEAMLRLGRALELQGQADPALHAYQSGLETVATVLRHGTQLHVQRSLLRLRQREMQQAWREAKLARFHAETMQGVVHDQSGDYGPARERYLSSLEIASEIGYEAGVAQMHHYLAMLAGRRQDLTTALHHFEQAINFYERIGDRVNREIVRSNLASVYIQGRQFAAAIGPASEALTFFTAMGNSVRIAQNASNLAEAHAELGNLDAAEEVAGIVLRQEEPQSHPYALYTLGSVYRRRGDWQEAGRFYEQSRRIAETNDDSYLAAFAWRALGEVARAQGDEPRAQTAFGQALELFEQLEIAEEARATASLAAQDDANPGRDDA